MPAELQFAQITDADVENVAHFLRKTFDTPDSWMPFRPETVRWKSLVPHPLWEGSRGYCLRRDGEIVAHGCVMPTRFVFEGGEALTACIIDWAANRTAPGAGVTIYRHIEKFTEGLIGVGGSDDAQKVLPRMGFKAAQEFEKHARVTGPLRAFAATRGRTWRDTGRLVRNVGRRFTAIQGGAKGWSARRVERFDASAAGAMPRPGIASGKICYRDADILNYFLLCPAGRMEAYLLERGGRVAGYFVLAFVRGECRIAELWVQSGDEADWAACYLLASEGRGASEVVTGCCTAVSQRAAARAGFHVSGRQPIYVKDSGGKLPGELDAAVGLLDTDAFYL